MGAWTIFEERDWPEAEDGFEGNKPWCQMGRWARSLGLIRTIQVVRATERFGWGASGDCGNDAVLALDVSRSEVGGPVPREASWTRGLGWGLRVGVVWGGRHRSGPVLCIWRHWGTG